MRRVRNLGEIVQPIPEIERFFRRRRRELHNNQEMAANQNRTLKEYAAPSTAENHGVIVHPNVEANNFELKPSLLSMVQQTQFSGSATDDPNLHLSIFLEICGTLKLNGVTPEAIRLKCFPFSLRDRARAWFHSLPSESVTTWDQLRQRFLSRFFLPSKTAHDGELVETVVAHDVIGRLMIQCALQPGLAQIWEDILGFENAEFYIKRWPELDGLPFKDILISFPDAIPCGTTKED